MPSDSRIRYGAVHGSSSAINLARPVRSGRSYSLTDSRPSFIINEGDRETVADVLAHLLPQTPVMPITPTEPAVIDESYEQESPPWSPLTPVASPATVRSTDNDETTDAATILESTDNDETTDAEQRSTEDSAQKRSPRYFVTKTCKRMMAITPPPRPVHQKTAPTNKVSKRASKVPRTTIAAKGKQAARITLGLQNSVPASTTAAVVSTAPICPGPVSDSGSPYPPYGASAYPTLPDPRRAPEGSGHSGSILAALSRKITTPTSITNSASSTTPPSISTAPIEPASTTDLNHPITNLLTIATNLLKRQRVLIHDYDTLDTQTYTPGTDIDAGTLALRQFVEVLRKGLYEMEREVVELGKLRDQV